MTRRLRRFTELSDELVSEGLCTAPKRAALVGWPGSLFTKAAGQSWELVREISHLKLVQRGGHPPHAKAYITVTPRLAS